jgi:hypothetical protein
MWAQILNVMYSYALLPRYWTFHCMYETCLNLSETVVVPQQVPMVLSEAGMLPVPVIHSAMPDGRPSVEMIQLGTQIANKPMVCHQHCNYVSHLVRLVWYLKNIWLWFCFIFFFYIWNCLIIMVAVQFLTWADVHVAECQISSTKLKQ